MVCLGNRQEIILLFLRLHPSTAFQTVVDYDGYSMFSLGCTDVAGPLKNLH